MDMIHEMKVNLAKFRYASDKTLKLANQFYDFVDSHGYTEDKLHEKGACNEALELAEAVYKSLVKDVNDAIRKKAGMAGVLAYRMQCFYHMKLKKYLSLVHT